MYFGGEAPCARLLFGPPGFNLSWYFSLLLIFSDIVWRRPVLSIARQLILTASPRFLFIMVVIMIYLFGLDDSKNIW